MRTKYKVLVAALAIMLIPSILRAQVYSVNFNKKVILTDELNMPANTSVYAILSMLPEMLQRSGTTYMSNYEIKIDGMAVGDASDVALHQLQILDVEKIEVSESSISGYTKNGQAGSINIFLKKQKDSGKKVWGSAALAGTFPLDITPQALIAYNSGKFQVKGLILGEYYNAMSDKETASYIQDNFSAATIDSKKQSFISQLARAYITFQPTDKDKLSFNVSENFSKNNISEGEKYKNDNQSFSNKTGTDLHAFLKYEHQFRRSKLESELQYKYTPSSAEQFYPIKQDYWINSRNHNIAGKLAYSYFIIPTTDSKYMKLTAGCAINENMSSKSVRYKNLNIDNFYENSLNPLCNSFFIQPYSELETHFGKFWLKISAEYQHFNYDISQMNNSFSVPSNNFTGYIVSEWHFNRHHNLRLILDRKLDRPNESQLFPVRLYNPEFMQYVEGSPELKPVLSHEIRLDYISDYQWDEHRLMLDMSTSYTNVSSIINSINTGGESHEGTIGLTQSYITFVNNGTDNILNGNFMALYRHKVFSASLTTNVYHNDQSVNDTHTHYTYFNISLNNSFNLDNSWNGSLKLVYNSKVDIPNGCFGSHAHTSLTVGKRINSVFVYVFDRVSLKDSSIDVKIDGNSRTEVSYDLSPNVAGIGIKWNF